MSNHHHLSARRQVITEEPHRKYGLSAGLPMAKNLLGNWLVLQKWWLYRSLMWFLTWLVGIHCILTTKYWLKMVDLALLRWDFDPFWNILRCWWPVLPIPNYQVGDPMKYPMKSPFFLVHSDELITAILRFRSTAEGGQVGWVPSDDQRRALAEKFNDLNKWMNYLGRLTLVYGSCNYIILILILYIYIFTW